MIEPVEEVGQYGGTWHRMASGPNDINITRITYCCLTRFNNFGTELVPDVAESWEANADSSVYTFHLRKGMKWSDGAPYTADDWVYYMDDHVGNDEHLAGQALGAAGLTASWPPWKSWTTIPSRFDFHGPYAFFPMYAASVWGVNMPNYPTHYLQQFHPDYADKAELDSGDQGRWLRELVPALRRQRTARRPTPSGPRPDAWKIDQPAPKQPMVAVRNPYYWKVDTEGNQLPYIDRIEWIVVTGGDMINLRAASGEVDMQLRHITFDNYPIFKENAGSGRLSRPGVDVGRERDRRRTSPRTMWTRSKSEILEDKRFRYALSLGVDRTEISEAVYFGTVRAQPDRALPDLALVDEEQANVHGRVRPGPGQRLPGRDGPHRARRRGLPAHARRRAPGHLLGLCAHLWPLGRHRRAGPGALCKRSASTCSSRNRRGSSSTSASGRARPSWRSGPATPLSSRS